MSNELVHVINHSMSRHALVFPFCVHSKYQQLHVAALVADHFINVSCTRAFRGIVSTLHEMCKSTVLSSGRAPRQAQCCARLRVSDTLVFCSCEGKCSSCSCSSCGNGAVSPATSFEVAASRRWNLLSSCHSAAPALISEPLPVHV